MSGPAAEGRRVDFVIGGAQKGGTTMLAATLAGHPGVVIPEIKEVHWFDNDERFRFGMPPARRYHALYGDPAAATRWGDPSPTYLWWPPAPERIRAYNPAMRWILLLRDPAARAYSHWNMEHTRGREKLDFRAALDAEPERMRTATMHQSRAFSYLSRGFYAEQIARLWRLFPREQVLVMRSDELRDAPDATVDRVLAFLGLPSMALPRPPDSFEGNYAQALDPADRAALVSRYASDIRQLETMLGWDLAAWLR